LKQRPVFLLEANAAPVAIDPATITHSILIAEADKTDSSGMDATEMVDQLQVLLNPTYWGAFAELEDPELIKGRRHLALVSEAVGPDAFMTVLDKLEIADESSVFLRMATVSLDGGTTSQEVATALVFREEEPRIVIAEQEPVMKRR
jgi:hypothetical protein